MACILHIETSAKVCSVAVSEDGKVIFEKADFEGPSHSVSCGLFVEEALSFAESHAIPLDAVAVSKGPGSYTGLRIGVSMAKGICYGRRVPLIGISTLKLICVPLLLYREDLPVDALYVPMIDARRMEVYSAVYTRGLKEVRGVRPDIVTADTYQEFLERGPVVFCGDGAMKCKDVIQHSNAIFVLDINPLAKNMSPLAEMAFLHDDFDDVAYFEPFYLKEFQATRSRDLLHV